MTILRGNLDKMGYATHDGEDGVFEWICEAMGFFHGRER